MSIVRKLFINDSHKFLFVDGALGFTCYKGFCEISPEKLKHGVVQLFVLVRVEVKEYVSLQALYQEVSHLFFGQSIFLQTNKETWLAKLRFTQNGLSYLHY